MGRIKTKRLYQVTDHTGNWSYWLFRTKKKAEKQVAKQRNQGKGFALTTLELGDEPLWIFESEKEIIEYANKLNKKYKKSITKSKVFNYWKDKIAWSTEKGQPYPCMSKRDFFKIIEQVLSGGVL